MRIEHLSFYHEPVPAPAVLYPNWPARGQEPHHARGDDGQPRRSQSRGRAGAGVLSRARQGRRGHHRHRGLAHATAGPLRSRRTRHLRSRRHRRPAPHRRRMPRRGRSADRPAQHGRAPAPRLPHRALHDRAVGHRLSPLGRRPARALDARGARGDRGLRDVRRQLHGGGHGRRGDPRRAGASDPAVPVAVHQPAQRCLRRQRREPDAVCPRDPGGRARSARARRHRRLQDGRGGVHGWRARHRAHRRDSAAAVRRGSGRLPLPRPGQLQLHRDASARSALADPRLSRLARPLQAGGERRPRRCLDPHPGSGAGRERARGGRGRHDRLVPRAHCRSRMAAQGAVGAVAGHPPLHRLQPVLGDDCRRRADRLRVEPDDGPRASLAAARGGPRRGSAQGDRRRRWTGGPRGRPRRGPAGALP